MTLKKFRTASIADLYAGSEPCLDLYVYSTANNPDGATIGTDAHFIGTADSYGGAYDLWDAARGAAKAIFGSHGADEIGLCIDADAYLRVACQKLLSVQDSRKADLLTDDLLDRWEADAIDQIRKAMGDKA